MQGLITLKLILPSLYLFERIYFEQNERLVLLLMGTLPLKIMPRGNEKTLCFEYVPMTLYF